MSLFNKYTEVIYSYIIGALSILLSVIIFINIPLIHELKDGKHHISDIYVPPDNPQMGHIMLQ